MVLQFIRSLKTKLLLWKKRRALGVFDKVKSQLDTFIGEASMEVDTRRDLINKKEKQVIQFKAQKEAEMEEQEEVISTVEAEKQKAIEVVNNLEQMGI